VSTGGVEVDAVDAIVCALRYFQVKQLFGRWLPTEDFASLSGDIQHIVPARNQFYAAVLAAPPRDVVDGKNILRKQRVRTNSRGG
jgi:hypothetical protein